MSGSSPLSNSGVILPCIGSIVFPPGKRVLFVPLERKKVTLVTERLRCLELWNAFRVITEFTDTNLATTQI